MNEKTKEIRYFSMFTGVGGFELGFQEANKKTKQRSNTSYKCVGMSEIDKYASELLAKKFPTIKNWGDCTKINPSELPDFDLLCGGFPCQAFSIAGQRRGFQDTRGTLFFEIARILEVKRPKLILLENVKGLLNHNKGQTFRKILQTLSELGYAIQWMVLNSKFFGVPQNRERVFIIGSLGKGSRPKILPIREGSQEIDKQQSGVSFPTVFASQYKIARGMPMIRAVLTPDRPEKRQNGRRFKEDGEPSFTLTGQDIHGVAYVTNEDGMKCVIRKLTPIECERLQGFPENWTEGFSDTQRNKMMGNAVTVNVIREIAEKLKVHK